MAFKMHEIRELIRLIDESTIEKFEIDNDGSKIVIKKASNRTEIIQNQPTPAPVVVQPEPAPVVVSAPVQEAPTKTEPKEVSQEAHADVDDPTLHKIVSPMVGTFYRAPAPDADPYVKEGDQVDEKTVVCIVEAMKLMNELEAEVRGTIVKVLVENGQLVEYGQPLFLVKKA